MFLDIIDPALEAANNSSNSPDIIVGIDFGTTNSLIAICQDDEPFVINIQENSALLAPHLLPSELEIFGYKIKSIKRLFGKTYDEIMSSNIFSSELKSIVRQDESNAAGGSIYIEIAGRRYELEELASQVFVKLKDAGEQFLNKTITKAVVTVPAYFDDVAKSMVKRAAQIAGIEVARLIAEPTAACYYYGLESKSEGDFLVYDFGGGTFDVSTIKIKNGVFKVCSSFGDNELGGDDIDYAVAKYLAEKYEIPSEIALSHAFLKKAKQVKEQGSESGGMTLNEDELDEISSNIIQRTITICKKAIFETSRLQGQVQNGQAQNGQAQNGQYNLDGIILVGGSTRLSSVKTSLEQAFPGVKIIDNIDPDTIVAKGAARQGNSLSTRSGDVIIDVVPLSLGIELMGGVVEKIIHRNTPIPATSTRKFTTYVDGQTGMEFKLMQGDRELASLCRHIGDFTLQNLPSKKAGQVEVEVTFNIDSDGLLSVTAEEKDARVVNKIEIRPSFGISEGEIYDMLKSAAENAESDFNMAKTITIRQEIASNIAALEKIFDAVDPERNSEDVNKLIKKCNDLSEKMDILSWQELEKELENLGKEAEDFIARAVNKTLSGYLSGRHINNIEGE